MSDAFGTTRWSVVLAVRSEDRERAREALAELCRTYWYPLYALVRRRVRDADEAADLTQDFFVYLIEKGGLKRAEPARGRFRSFLIASVKNFLANEHDRTAARKRGGGLKPVTFDGAEAERHYLGDARAGWEQEKAFDRQWALVVLQRGFERLRAEYSRAGKTPEFEQLSPFLTGEGGDRPYREVAAILETTESAVKTSVHRMRRRYGQALRQEVAETLADPEETDAELKHLLAALEE